MGDLPAGVPVWLYLVSVLLSGGIGGALFQFLAVRTQTKAGRDITASDARLKDVTALSDALTSLSAENARLIQRVKDVETKNAALEARVDELDEELVIQRRRRYELENHLAVAEQRIDTLENEIVTLGGNPDGVG